MTVRTYSPQETIELGKKIGRRLKKGDFIAFSGDLGAGKTTITRGIAVGLGLEDEVTSPTFSIVNEYESKSAVSLYHFDMYRIMNSTELEFTGFFDYPLEESVFIIEWSENIKDIIPENAIRIDIKYIDENTREISIEGDLRFADTWN